MARKDVDKTAVGGELPGRLARNIKTLREARGLTQEQMSRVSGIPRATWGHLESGSANPTLSVLHRVAVALQVPIEELTSTPRASCRYYPRDRLPERRVPVLAVERLGRAEGDVHPVEPAGCEPLPTALV